MTDKLTELSLSSYLNQKFNVLKTFHLYYDYIYNPTKLYKELLTVKKESFAFNDRIVFMFADTDYYFYNRFGLGLYNTYKIIDYLNIPTFCCLFVTQQDYIKKDIQQLNETYFSHDRPIKVVELYIDSPSEILSKIKPTTLNVSIINKHFTFLNHHNRKHRSVFYSLLDNKNLLDRGQVSFEVNKSISTIQSDKLLNMVDVQEMPDNLEIIATTPLTICNENWQIKNSNMFKIYNNFLQNIPQDFTYKNFNETISSNEDLQPANPTLIQNSFLYISSETMFEYPGSYLTEKSLKGFACMRPFVVLGPPHSLKKLHDYGFKTFNTWWNEDYDKLTDPSERLEAVFDIVEYINKKSIAELKEICNDMSEVLHYNYHHLTNNFVRAQLDSLDKQCSE